MPDIIDLFLNLDKHLNTVIQNFGFWTYFILFLIIFCETGLVATPFLPGDSLLFAAGALAAGSSLQVGWLFVLLSVAAVAGDTVNYWIGYFMAPKCSTTAYDFSKRSIWIRPTVSMKNMVERLS